jgi:hypothetical protein
MRLTANNPGELTKAMKRVAVPKYLWKLDAQALYDLLDLYAITTTLSVVTEWKRQNP